MPTTSMVFRDKAILRQTLRKKSTCWFMGMVLTACWTTVMGMHHHFNEFNDDEEVRKDFNTAFGIAYGTMIVYTIQWSLILQLFEINRWLSTMPSFIGSTALLFDSIYLQTIDYDNVGHMEYKNIILAVGIIQFLCINILNFLVFREEGRIPGFCISGEYRLVETVTHERYTVR